MERDILSRKKIKTDSLSKGPAHYGLAWGVSDPDIFNLVHTKVPRTKGQENNLATSALGECSSQRGSLAKARSDRIEELNRAIEALAEVGLAVEVKRVSKQPLAMGNTETVVETWVANHRIIEPVEGKIYMMRGTQIKYRYLGYTPWTFHAFAELVEGVVCGGRAHIRQDQLHLFEGWPEAVDPANIKYRVVTRYEANEIRPYRAFMMSHLLDTRLEAEVLKGTMQNGQTLQPIGGEHKYEILEVDVTCEHRPKIHRFGLPYNTEAWLKLKHPLNLSGGLLDDEVWMSETLKGANWMPAAITPTSSTVTDDSLAELRRLDADSGHLLFALDVFEVKDVDISYLSVLNYKPIVEKTMEQRRAEVLEAIRVVEEGNNRLRSKLAEAVAAFAKEVAENGVTLSGDQEFLTVGNLTFKPYMVLPEDKAERNKWDACKGCRLTPVCNSAEGAQVLPVLINTCTKRSRSANLNVIWLKIQ